MMISRLLLLVLVVAGILVIGGSATLVGLVLADKIDAGLNTKTAWEWMDVLAVPVAVAGIAVLGAAWGQLQARRRSDSDEELNADRERDAAFTGYVNLITNLIPDLIDKNLDPIKDNARARLIARAHTFDVLGRLDGQLKRKVVFILIDMGLLSGESEHVVDLAGADLGHADLKGFDLESVEMSSANLARTNLFGTILSHANLAYADLSNADMRESVFEGAVLVYAGLSHGIMRYSDLSETDLSFADLSYADLRGATLINADLTEAILSYADLREAMLTDTNMTRVDLSNANLRGANLQGVNLTSAIVTRDQLIRVDDLVGATLPDGSKVTEVVWENMKQTRRIRPAWLSSPARR
jgi:uncharacterized protein YjbI with pentapeptide repeats